MANSLSLRIGSPILHSDSLNTFLWAFSGKPNTNTSLNKSVNLRTRRLRGRNHSAATRRILRYEDEEDEDYGHNHQIALLESYTQATAGEALIVHAALDGHLVQVLVFKGFSSCLNSATSPDPSRSVLPARAVIKSIDRIKGPFDPSNIEYLEKGITWESFNFPK